jgi:hypothetical protein
VPKRLPAATSRRPNFDEKPGLPPKDEDFKETSFFENSIDKSTKVAKASKPTMRDGVHVADEGGA